MRAIRRGLRRLSGRPQREAAAYAYTVHWTQQARGWDAARRREAHAALQALLTAPDFEPGLYQRRYVIEAVDALPHAGASLQALLRVLEALDAER